MTLRVLGISGEVLTRSARTTLATVASMLLARGLKLPEYYWAPISTSVILLSTLDPRTHAWERFAGTALGAAMGALIASFLHPTWIIYGTGIFACGILCSLFRVSGAYRLAAITLTIVLLTTHQISPWRVAIHRFIEVSLGIAVALVVTIAWPMPNQK